MKNGKQKFLNKYLIEGSIVRFVVGNFEVSGAIKECSKKHILLVTELGDDVIVKKSKIDLFSIIKKTNYTANQVEAFRPIKNGELRTLDPEKNVFLYKASKPNNRKESLNEMEAGSGDLSEGGVSLPHEVLISLANTEKPILSHQGDDNDFSISMSSLVGDNKNRLSVTSDDE